MNHLQIFTKKKTKKLSEDGYENSRRLPRARLPIYYWWRTYHDRRKIVSYKPMQIKKKSSVAVSKASQELAEKAMEVADDTFNTWKKVKPEFRADVLFKAAAIIRRRKHEFSALLTKEAGKPWNEADADTAEAIDFLEYLCSSNAYA